MLYSYRSNKRENKQNINQLYKLNDHNHPHTRGVWVSIPIVSKNAPIKAAKWYSTMYSEPSKPLLGFKPSENHDNRWNISRFQLSKSCLTKSFSIIYEEIRYNDKGTWKREPRSLIILWFCLIWHVHWFLVDNGNSPACCLLAKEPSKPRVLLNSWSKSNWFNQRHDNNF